MSNNAPSPADILQQVDELEGISTSGSENSSDLLAKNENLDYTNDADLQEVTYQDTAAQEEVAPTENTLQEDLGDDTTLTNQEELSTDDDTNHLEVSAREKGWKPLEEFSGDPTDWVDYDEFMRREPLFQRIREQSKTQKNLEKKLDAMMQALNADREAKLQDELAGYEYGKKEAIELGDADTVAAYDKLIEEKRQAVQQIKAQQPQQPQMIPEAVEFIEKNSNWWNSHSPNHVQMREYAQQRDNILFQTRPDIDHKTRYNIIQAELNEKFSAKPPSKTPRPTQRSVAVEKSTKATTNKKAAPTVRDLGPEQLKVYKNLPKNVKDSYFQNLVKTNKVGEI